MTVDESQALTVDEPQALTSIQTPAGDLMAT